HAGARRGPGPGGSAVGKLRGGGLAAAREPVADARLAADRHTRALEVRDVAVHGAFRDAELARDLLARREAPRAQQLHESEESVSAAHARSASRAEPDGMAVRVRDHPEEPVPVSR